MSESVRPKGVGFPETYHARDAIQTSDVNASLIRTFMKIAETWLRLQKGRLNRSWKKRLELTDDGQLVCKTANGKFWRLVHNERYTNRKH